MQIIATLYNEFNYADEKFPKSKPKPPSLPSRHPVIAAYENIASLGDFYNWLKGPVQAFIVAGVSLEAPYIYICVCTDHLCRDHTPNR